jgi:hypothetical protein
VSAVARRAVGFTSSRLSMPKRDAQPAPASVYRAAA